MSQTLQLIMALVERQDVLISEHGYDELPQMISWSKISWQGSVMLRWSKIIPTIIRDHVLVLQRDQQGRPIHVVWGIPKHATALQSL